MGNVNMETVNKISLLYPDYANAKYKVLPDVTVHDLGLDMICKKLSAKEPEQNLILRVMSKMTDDPRVTQYRCDIFSDIYANKKMRDELMEILDKINFLKDYGSFKSDYEETASTWELLHRLGEIKDYISCVDALYHCLSGVELKSEGLCGLREYVQGIYQENGFAELKKDIDGLRATTSDLKSVTVGINLNDRFEASGIGLISINNKYFTKSGIIGNFSDMLSRKDSIKEGTDWDGSLKYHPFSEAGGKALKSMERAGRFKVATANPLMAGLAVVPDGDATEDITHYMDRVTNHMLALTVKKLREVLNKYVTITITDMTGLIPEFIYYIRWAEYIEQLCAQGHAFCKAKLAAADAAERVMRARDIYNLKLAFFATKEHEEIVTNDLDFDPEHLVYILTGANRGGKTTITQAIGLLFVLAQGGIFVPGASFEFHPVDGIYTHFPADEDKTMDLGRLGEECKRFREIYKGCTKNSLLLLNETFSTTSFEEGYYIAKDSVKAILHKGVRTIYNTHMHKLAFDIEEMNAQGGDGKAQSLVMRSDGGQRSYKVELAPPTGMSYAQDIAKKYGVTLEMLLE